MILSDQTSTTSSGPVITAIIYLPNHQRVQKPQVPGLVPEAFGFFPGDSWFVSCFGHRSVLHKFLIKLDVSHCAKYHGCHCLSTMAQSVIRTKFPLLSACNCQEIKLHMICERKACLHQVAQQAQTLILTIENHEIQLLW